MKTKLIAFATAVLCTVAISLGLAGKVYTVSAMEYGRTYCCHYYLTNDDETYTLYGEDIISSISTRSGTVDDRVPDKTNSAVVWTTTGTGFIVDDHIIATAAHCVYDHGFEPIMDIKIYSEDGSKLLTQVSAAEIHVPNAYIHYSNSHEPKENKLAREYDYALIYTIQDLSEYGVLPLAVPTDNFMTSNANVNISGYPGATTSNPYADGNTRLHSNGNVMDIREHNIIDPDNMLSFERQIMCSTYSSDGNSGGPMYIATRCLGKYYKTAIGIETGGIARTDYRRSYGVRVTSDLLLFYYNNPNIGLYEDYLD